jgi:outer membrane protein OmpA-like peptidoglycan-associated protein
MERTPALVLGIVLLVTAPILALTWVSSAADRLSEADKAEQASPTQVAVAQEANEAYCTPELKQILRRVLASCGLLGASGGRGCQPLEAKKGRGGIVQFELNSAGLDPGDVGLTDKVFAERGGASYFFVVARASQDGSTEKNRELSKQRAQAVMDHLTQAFDDPELNKQVGLLWLGEEYAQLDPSFCQWQRSGGVSECQPEDLNRSAFLAWIDCRL